VSALDSFAARATILSQQWSLLWAAKQCRLSSHVGAPRLTMRVSAYRWHVFVLSRLDPEQGGFGIGEIA
jgi:hypothetical protein